MCTRVVLVGGATRACTAGCTYRAGRRRYTAGTAGRTVYSPVQQGALCAEHCRLSQQEGALCAEQCRLSQQEQEGDSAQSGACSSRRRRETLRRVVPAPLRRRKETLRRVVPAPLRRKEETLRRVVPAPLRGRRGDSAQSGACSS